MKTAYQIEQNELDPITHYFMYLKEDGTTTDTPVKALRFDTAEKAEEYRKVHDLDNKFHIQRMIVG